MSPVQVLASSESNALQVKNTFLHCAPDDNEFDDNDWIIRRQASEPAPKRQFSDAKRNSAVLQAPVLEECDEEADFSDSDDLELTASDGLFRQVSSFKRQTSALANTLADIHRQISTVSAQGFDKQVSCISTAGFCRQETEMEWPIYAKAEFAAGLQSPPAALQEARPTEVNSVNEGCGNVEVLPLDQLIAEPVGEPAAISVDAMAAQMNNLMWANIMWNASWGMNQKANNFATSVPPSSNRRKARSLITQAQEAQRAQQNFHSAEKVSAAKQYLEQQPQLAEQRQQLGQQLKTMMGMTPDSQQESEVQISERNRELVAPQATSKARFCPCCGGNVLQRFKFCRYCGEDVAQLWEA
jgi:hypothetical protein